MTYFPLRSPSFQRETDVCRKSAKGTRDSKRPEVLNTGLSEKKMPSHDKAGHPHVGALLWKVSSIRARLVVTSTSRSHSQRNDGLIWPFYSHSCGSRFNALSASRDQPSHDEKLIRASLVPRISSLLGKSESNESKRTSIINISLASIYFGSPSPPNFPKGVYCLRRGLVKIGIILQYLPIPREDLGMEAQPAAWHELPAGSTC